MNVIDHSDVLNEIKTQLQRNIGHDLKELWLFGSRARGDNDLYSDYDILLVAEGNISKLKEIIQSIEWSCMEKYGIVVASVVYTPEIWKIAKHSPLGINILKEGLEVA